MLAKPVNNLDVLMENASSLSGQLWGEARHSGNESLKLFALSLSMGITKNLLQVRDELRGKAGEVFVSYPNAPNWIGSIGRISDAIIEVHPKNYIEGKVLDPANIAIRVIAKLSDSRRWYEDDVVSLASKDTATNGVVRVAAIKNRYGYESPDNPHGLEIVEDPGLCSVSIGNEETLNHKGYPLVAGVLADYRK